MRPTALALLIGALASPLAAQEALGPEAFESYTTGKTLRFGAGGQVYGAEQYLPGRRVIWAFLGEPCKYGAWFARGEEICFVYDDEPGAHCWKFFIKDNVLLAEFTDAPFEAPLVEVSQSPDPLACPGPDVGV
jgi:hypothetical protein